VGKISSRYACGVMLPGKLAQMYIGAMLAKSVGHYKRKQAFETPARRFMLFIGHMIEKNYKSRHIGTRKVSRVKSCFCY